MIHKIHFHYVYMSQPTILQDTDTVKVPDAG